ncbi:crosslink repair DNA glycosylase YcaQ family protein [Loktanella sp. SALINAS62]|uniref:winged helix-turn-helix domain-containing protein n=1 Tax=Loktanella sp. SALINAS62 TaxID=2706124 RepID=UPI001B8B08F5|nr:crosslink repair DNA glycosylase YcaQ family protein [Loktanella sp. SALINAS62]MBS1300988.1 winged helix-turn-helix domain-containing protein [Loktanella sp. SALINAS62]
MAVTVLDNAHARRVFLDRHGLGRTQAATAKGVIDDLGFVQVDSVNTFARAHDMILWSRHAGWRPPVMDRLMARDRAVFEHWTHDASVIPMELWPLWRLRCARDAARLESRWERQRPAGFGQEVDTVLRQIADHGACTSGDVGAGEVRGGGGWWNWHPSKTALEYLWRSGRVAVARRRGFRKIYDLTERVIPGAVRDVHLPDDQIIDRLCHMALDRLGFATSGEIAAFWAIVTPAEARDWCAEALADGHAVAVDVTGYDGKQRRCLARPDVPDSAPEVTGQVRLLSPFDPALRDRKRAEWLFGFRYRIEIFVPEAQRRYGYYVFPVWEGDRAIGRIDMARQGDVLQVRAYWPEPGVAMGKRRLARLDAALNRAARFGDCAQVGFAPDWLRAAG